MAEPTTNQATPMANNPEEVNEKFRGQAKELISLIGHGVPFETIEAKLHATIGEAFSEGAASLQGVDMSQLDLRQTLALEKIEGHLAAFRKHGIDEDAPVGMMRELLAKCREMLRFPQMQAQPELMREIDEVLHR